MGRSGFYGRLTISGRIATYSKEHQDKMSNVVWVVCAEPTLECTVVLGTAHHTTDRISDFEPGRFCLVTQRNNIAGEITAGTGARLVRGVNELY